MGKLRHASHEKKPSPLVAAVPIEEQAASVVCVTVGSGTLGALTPAQRKWLEIFPKDWGDVPCFHPEFRDGMPVATVRALQRRGLIEDTYTGIFFSPFDGIKAPTRKWRRVPNLGTQAI